LIYRGSPEIGFCLYDPQTEWEPENLDPQKLEEKSVSIGNRRDLYLSGGKVHLPSGVMNIEELTAIFNTLPFDITFVDKDDYVRFFSQGENRIFPRNALFYAVNEVYYVSISSLKYIKSCEN
jgi:DUF438 domain-containing protein